MPSAGDIITVPTVPGSRVATAEKTSDSATFTTTEIEVHAIVAPLVAGRTYRIRFVGGFQSNAGGQLTVFLREGTVGGTQLQNLRVDVAGTSSTTGYGVTLEREVTAGATGDQTYAVTAQQFSGTGTSVLKAAATRPAYLYVDYIRG